MREWNFYGPGMGFGRGGGRRMAGGLRGNPYPYCRFNTALASRRAMASAAVGKIEGNPFYQAEYLKNAEHLKAQLDEVNERLKEMED